LKLDFDLSSYFEKVKNSNSFFHTFINRDSLAVGLLVLKPGEEDTQTPMPAMRCIMLFQVMDF